MHHYQERLLLENQSCHYKGLAVCIQYSTTDTELIKSLPGLDPCGRSEENQASNKSQSEQ